MEFLNWSKKILLPCSGDPKCLAPPWIRSSSTWKSHGILSRQFRGNPDRRIGLITYVYMPKWDGICFSTHLLLCQAEPDPGVSNVCQFYTCINMNSFLFVWNIFITWMKKILILTLWIYSMHSSEIYQNIWKYLWNSTVLELCCWLVNQIYLACNISILLRLLCTTMFTFTQMLI